MSELGYIREGDVVTLRMTEDDYQALLLRLGRAAASMVDTYGRDALVRELDLANRINAGNPDWTPYGLPAEAKG